jgi:hypothetical protein
LAEGIFGWTDQSARNFIHVYERFKFKNFLNFEFGDRRLCALSNRYPPLFKNRRRIEYFESAGAGAHHSPLVGRAAYPSIAPYVTPVGLVFHAFGAGLRLPGVSQRRFFSTEPVSIYSAAPVRTADRSIAAHQRLARTICETRVTSHPDRAPPPVHALIYLV